MCGRERLEEAARHFEASEGSSELLLHKAHGHGGLGVGVLGLPAGQRARGGGLVGTGARGSAAAGRGGLAGGGPRHPERPPVQCCSGLAWPARALDPRPATVARHLAELNTLSLLLLPLLLQTGHVEPPQQASLDVGLRAAAASGHPTAVRLLLEHGAQVEPQDEGASALLLAARPGHLEVARELLAASADVNGGLQRSPLHSATWSLLAVVA